MTRPNHFSRRLLLKRSAIAIGACSYASAISWAADAAAAETAVLQARVKIPASLLARGTKRDPERRRPDEEYLFAGDIRIGDLNGDGTVDFVLARSLGGMKICYIAAFTWTGKVLWEWGDKSRRIVSADKEGQEYTATVPARPGPLLVIDLDGDGRMEVVAITLRDGIDRTSIWDMNETRFVVLDGATGRVKRTASPEALVRADARDASGNLQISNYVHHRLLAADFRGLGTPRDLVVKLGDTVLACDDRLRPLWTYRNKYAEYPKHSPYVPAVGDMDGDGRDELFGGNYVIDDDGRVLWEKLMAQNNDSVAIVDWDGIASNGLEGVLSGFGQVVRASGEVVLKLGEKLVPHGQEVRCGRFRDDLAGVQMAIRYNGHEPDILIAGREGKILSRFRVDRSPLNVGMDTLRWFGANGPDLLLAPPALWDGHGRRAVTLPDLPKPAGRARDDWWHCVPADLDGSGHESAVLYNPCADEIFIYGAKALGQNPPAKYRHTPRQYNPRVMD